MLCVVVGAVPVGEVGVIKQYIKEGDLVIYCDGGLYNREILGIEPDIVVADFDSYPEGEYAAKTIRLPHMKDDTDVAVAVDEALRMGYDDFLLVGCIGRRFDHSLGNISVLLHLDDLGKHGVIVDDYSQMEIVSARSGPVTVDPQFPYFSLMVVDGAAKGVSIENALYSHDDIEMAAGSTLGISNEPLPGQSVRVKVSQGRLLLLRIFDAV